MATDLLISRGLAVLVAGILLLSTALFFISPAYSSPQYGSAFAIVTDQAQPVGVTVDSSGTLYWVNWGSGELLSLASGASSPRVLLTGLSSPQGLGVDSQGNLYFTEYFAGNLDELKVGSSSKVVLASGLNYPNYLSVTPAGDVYFITGATCGNAIMKYDHVSGSISTILTRNTDTGHGFGGVFADASGDVYYTTCQSQTVEVLLSGSSSPQVLVSGIPYTNGIVGDSKGDLFFNSYYSGVYMLQKGASSPVEITAQNTAHYMIALDSAGDVYFSDNTGGNIWEVPLVSTSTTVTVNTNESSYFGSQSLTVFGTVSPVPTVNGTNVVITCKNPTGTTVLYDEAAVSTINGSYSEAFVTGGSASWVAGTYTVNATYVFSSVSGFATATFSYSPTLPTVLFALSGTPSQVSISGVPYLSVTYNNPGTTQVMGIVVLSVQNAAGQTVYITTSTIKPAAASSQMAYLDLGPLGSGSYTGNLFVVSTSGGSLSAPTSAIPINV